MPLTFPSKFQLIEEHEQEIGENYTCGPDRVDHDWTQWTKFDVGYKFGNKWDLIQRNFNDDPTYWVKAECNWCGWVFSPAPVAEESNGGGK